MAWAYSSGVALPPNGESAPTPTPVLPCPSSPTPPFCFVLHWGGPSQVLGIPPHLLYQAAHEGHARLLGGCPPSPLGWGPAPPLLPVPVCRALGAHAARGIPLGVYVILGAPRPCMPCSGSARCSGGAPSFVSCLRGIPSSRSGMPCAGSACCLTGGSPPSSGLRPRAEGASGPSPAPLSTWLGRFPSSCSGMLYAGSARCRTGGFPLRPGLGLKPWARAVRPSPPVACARFACAAGARGPHPLSRRGI